MSPIDKEHGAWKIGPEEQIAGWSGRLEKRLKGPLIVSAHELPNGDIKLHSGYKSLTVKRINWLLFTIPPVKNEE